MDFGDIFFIFVFIIIIVSNVYKQMKKTRLKASGGEMPVKKPGWKGALELILEEAKKQMENQVKQGATGGTAGVPVGRPTGWEGVLTQPLPEASPSKGPWNAPLKTNKAAPEALKPEKSIIEKAASVKFQETGQPPLRYREKMVSAPEQAADGLQRIMGMPEPVAVPKDYYADKTDKKRPRQLSQEALRNAVVWAEILAPPVGLREME